MLATTATTPNLKTVVICNPISIAASSIVVVDAGVGVSVAAAVLAVSTY